MTHKLLILITALVLAGCIGKTRTNNTQTAEPTANESTTNSPELFAEIDVARYRQ